MDYQKEYASLVGQVDRAISLLEHYAPGDPIVRKAGDLLLTALREAEEHYIQAADESDRLEQIGALAWRKNWTPTEMGLEILAERQAQ